MATIKIGCKLPNGLIIFSPDGKNEIKLDGFNKESIRAKMVLPSSEIYGVTEVDEQFWANWKGAYSDYAPLVSGAIFEAKDTNSLRSIAKELSGIKTGFDSVSKDANEISAL